MFDFLLSEDAKRRKLLAIAPEGPVKDFLSSPLIERNQDVHAVSLLSLDFETSGLDPGKDHIVSAGYVVISRGEVLLSTAMHELVRPDKLLTENSVVIHKITDDDASAGKSLEEVISSLLLALAGKVMVAHNANIELAFLTQACRKLYGISPRFPAIDTMRIAKKWLERRNKEIEQGDLRLFNLRKRYGLPVYQAHNALTDAIATAELLQAQIAHMDSSVPLRLSRFLS